MGVESWCASRRSPLYSRHPLVPRADLAHGGHSLGAGSSFTHLRSPVEAGRSPEGSQQLLQLQSKHPGQEQLLISGILPLWWGVEIAGQVPYLSFLNGKASDQCLERRWQKILDKGQPWGDHPSCLLGLWLRTCGTWTHPQSSAFIVCSV